MARWADFLVKDHDNSSFLSSLPDTRQKNIFTTLDDDFHHPKNLANKLLLAFNRGIFVDFHDSVQDARGKVSVGDGLLEGLVESLQTFANIMCYVVGEYYSPIASLLERHRDKLLNLVFTHLVRGEVFRMLHDLYSDRFAEEIKELREGLSNYPAHPSDSRLISHLHRFLTAESPYEKEYQLKRLAKEAKACDNALEAVLQALKECLSSSVLPHLCITEALLPNHCKTGLNFLCTVLPVIPLKSPPRV
jgi:hypothetical protein